VKQLGYLLVGLVSLALFVAPAMAQGVSEANGIVVDRDGNPLKDAVVKIRPKSNPDTEYTGKTNKKGRFFIAGMFTSIADEKWLITCELAGYTATEVVVESRTVNKVLVADPWTAKLKPSSSPPEIRIRPLGAAKLDWKMARTEDVEAELQAAASAAAAAAGAAAGEAGTAGGAQQPAKDPWVEALTLASAGSLEESVEFFQKAVEEDAENAERHETFVEIDPARVESQMVLFNVAEKRGDLETARSILETAKAVAPRDTRILMRLAFVARQTGDSAGAIAAYKQAVEIDPENAEAWLELAGLHAEAGNFEASEAAYAKVVEIDPKGAHQTYYNLGATIVKRGAGSASDTERAIAAFKKALEIKPDYAIAAQELAIALITTGDKDGARTTLQAFVDKNPSAPEAARMKALIKSLQ
jgi:tetratricopeptide (TPR) repeat protein